MLYSQLSEMAGQQRNAQLEQADQVAKWQSSGHELFQNGLTVLPIFGSSIHWRGMKMSVGNCQSPDEAKIKVIWMAEKQGWTNPRWYEFWRIWRGDTWFDPAEIARLKAKYEGDNQLSEEVG